MSLLRASWIAKTSLSVTEASDSAFLSCVWGGGGGGGRGGGGVFLGGGGGSGGVRGCFCCCTSPLYTVVWQY